MTGKLEIYVGVPTVEETAFDHSSDTATVLAKRYVHPLAHPDFDGWPDFVSVKGEGTETGSCVAAIDPRPDEHLVRLLQGSKKRDETALLVQEVSSSFAVPGFQGGIKVEGLPEDIEPDLADGLKEVDKDFALRLRDADVRWSSLSLREGSFDVGASLQPLLVDALGKPLVAVWLPSAGTNQRWYIIPPECPWKSITDWLVHRAIPEFVPNATNRVYELAAIEDAFVTEEEREAQAAIDAFDLSTNKQREALEAGREAAKKKADEVRTALLYKSGNTLKRAVATVLDSCGFDIEDLDDTFGEPLSSDLLATRGDQHWLIEARWAGGYPNEDKQVGSVVKHMRTWEELGRSEKLEHGVLILNHHSKKPPPARPSTPFLRKEFIAALPDYGVTAISSMALCRWWAARDCESLISAVTGPAGQHVG